MICLKYILSSFRGLSDKWLLVNALDYVCVASPNIDTYTENIDMYTEYAYIDIILVVKGHPFSPRLNGKFMIKYELQFLFG